MCGIIGAYGIHDLTKQAASLTHRGPDEEGHHKNDFSSLAHKRLSIVDLSTGRQPIKGRGETYVIHNGEIYNHEDLRKGCKHQDFHTTSDSEVIVRLYEEKGVTFLNELDGVFAFVLQDGDKLFAARDPIGVKPLFYGFDNEGNIWFASEMKALSHLPKIWDFPPGHYYLTGKGFNSYYEPLWRTQPHKGLKVHSNLKDPLINAVCKRLMADVPLGVLLSGGLDSSLIASIVCRYSQHKVKSFSVGVEGSPDLKAARLVADYLGTEHHEIIFTVEEGVNEIYNAIHYMETYDVTTIRSGTPMMLMAKYIRDQGVKVVLSGEGADEIFGGYLYFQEAPTPMAFHEETIDRVGRLYKSDVLRADKAMMAHAIEVRVPFLDRHFLNEAMKLHPNLKQTKVEKEILRATFAGGGWLPDEILWRQKEQFSDGVGYSWIDGLKDHAEKLYSDLFFVEAKSIFSVNPPETKEALWYRFMFDNLFPAGRDQLIQVWEPKWQKNKDPSGRVSHAHREKK